jgi:histidinol-phosphate aminotransferase
VQPGVTGYRKPALRGFEAYVPGEQPPDSDGWIKLNTNESPLPPSAKVVEAVAAAARDLRLYPSPTAQPARDAVARLHGVDASWVAAGNGSDELIAMCFRAFAGLGDAVAYCEPTYPLFQPLAAIHENDPHVYRLGEGWTLPREFVRDPAPLKFLVNPNSPIGNWYPAEVVEEVVSASEGVVVVDEAYVDFAPESRIDLVGRHPNALILRTLSKSAALAGLRFGYAIARPEIIQSLDLVKDSYNVSRLTIAGAVAALEDSAHRDRIVQEIVRERDWLTAQLSGLGFQVEPSATNFVFCRPPSRISGGAVADALRELKILVRRYERDPIAGWLRVTVGTHDQMEALVEALGGVLG